MRAMGRLQQVVPIRRSSHPTGMLHAVMVGSRGLVVEGPSDGVGRHQGNGSQHFVGSTSVATLDTVR